MNTGKSSCSRTSPFRVAAKYFWPSIQSPVRASPFAASMTRPKGVVWYVMRFTALSFSVIPLAFFQIHMVVVLHDDLFRFQQKALFQPSGHQAPRMVDDPVTRIV